MKIFCGMAAVIAAAAAVALLAGCVGCAVEPPGYVEISGANIRVRCSPRAGGRISFISGFGSPNLVDADAARCAEPPEAEDGGWQREFENLRGAVLWTAPQSRWWVNQNRYPDKARRASPWPPDPYWEYARSRVVGLRRDRVVLEVPESLVSGLSMRFSLRVDDDTLYVEYQVKNETSSPRKLGLWSVLRVPPEQVAVEWDAAGGVRKFQPGATGETIRLGSAAGARAEYRIDYPALEVRLVKRFSAVSAEAVAPGHSALELYYAPSGAGAGAILELENHTPYTVLNPGCELFTAEQWRVERGENRK